MNDESWREFAPLRDADDAHGGPRKLKSCAADGARYTPLKLSEFVQRPSTSTLIGGIAAPKNIVVIFGPPKEGKTYLTCDLLMTASHGWDWHGCKVGRPLRIVWLVGEGVPGFKVRLKAWLETHGSVGIEAAFTVLPEPLGLTTAFKQLSEDLQAYEPDIIVLDTLNTYFGGGDENSTQDMTKFCNAIRYLRDRVGACIFVIHHTGHGDSGRERGSIVLRASADVVIQVGKDTSNKDLVGLQVVAARDLEAWSDPISVRLVRHETDWVDDQGIPLVACVVQGAEYEQVTLPGRGGPSLGPVQAAMLRAAKTLAQQRRVAGESEVHLARSDVLDEARRRSPKMEISKQSAWTTWKPLEKRGLWRRVEPGSIAIRVGE